MGVQIMRINGTIVSTILLACLASQLLVTRALSQQDVASATAGTTGKELAELDRQWLEAARMKDVAFLESLFADNFVERHGNGEVVNKEKQIAQIKASKTHIVGIHPNEIVVRYLSSDVAILTDKTTIDGVSEGVSKTGVYNVLRVYVKQEGHWRAAAAGLTPVVDPSGAHK